MRARATDHTVTATEKPTTTTGKAKTAAPASRHRVPSVTTDHSRPPAVGPGPSRRRRDDLAQHESGPAPLEGPRPHSP